MDKKFKKKNVETRNVLTVLAEQMRGFFLEWVFYTNHDNLKYICFYSWGWSYVQSNYTQNLIIKVSFFF